MTMNRRVGRSVGFVVAVLLTILALVPGILTACGSEVDSAEGVLQLEQADNGKSFTVKVGDTIEVVLAGNPTTGFAWTAALGDEDGTLLEQQGDPAYVSDSSDDNVVGAGGLYTFTFKAVAEGEAELKLVYARSFESVPPEQTFAATLMIE
jgi:inhibitor of cysteine peptidase